MATETETKVLDDADLSRFADFEVRSVKSWNTHDGGGFSAVLYHLGFPVAEVVDEGTGGGAFIGWYYAPRGKTTDPRVTTAEAALDAAVKAHPPVKSEYTPDRPLTVSEDWIMTAMVNAADFRKRIARAAKTKTCFWLPGDDKHSFRTATGPGGRSATDYLDRKYGPGGYTLLGTPPATESPAAPDTEAARRTWDGHAARLGLDPGWFGRTFQMGRRTYTITGLDPHRPKNPVLVRRDDGKGFAAPSTWVADCIRWPARKTT